MPNRTLRGVDLPTTCLMVAILVVAAIVLTIVALFFAPLARGRTGRIANLLAVILIHVVIKIVVLLEIVKKEYVFVMIIMRVIIVKEKFEKDTSAHGPVIFCAMMAQILQESLLRSPRL